MEVNTRYPNFCIWDHNYSLSYHSKMFLCAFLENMKPMFLTLTILSEELFHMNIYSYIYLWIIK